MINTIATNTIMQKKNSAFLSDIHTHILPGIDDGAATVEESVKMLLMEAEQGVTDVVLTPHFSLSGESIEAFLEKRNESFKLLTDKIEENENLKNISLHLGAEVKYDPNLVYSDIFKLCIGNTSYLLLELDKSYPFNLEQTLDWMLTKGVTPILAHIERYGYLVTNQKLLEELLEAGVVFQCNASSVLKRRHARIIKKLMKKGFVHVLASDAHGTEERPPILKKGIESVAKFSQMLMENSVKIVEDKLI